MPNDLRLKKLEGIRKISKLRRDKCSISPPFDTGFIKLCESRHKDFMVLPHFGFFPEYFKQH